MKRFSSLLFLLFFAGDLAIAQFLAGPLPAPEKAIRQNSVSVIDALGDSVWIGPRLNYNFFNSTDWPVAEVDSVKDGRFSVFSLALRPDTVVAGLGFYKTIAGSDVATSGGFYTSVDGGDSWKYIPPPLDPQGTVFRVVNRDTLRGYYNFRYGSRNILALAVTVPEQSVPWDVDVRSSVLFIASWASGIRRSRDFGQTWERLLLPPFEQPSLSPNSTYTFIYQPTPPRTSDTSNPNTGESWTNFLGFSVLIDVQNRVWVGTAGGLNRSENAFYAPTDSVSWIHTIAGTTEQTLPANWIITLRQNPADSMIWMTNWIGTNSSGTESFGISATRNGETFQRFLSGERIYDIAFSGRSVFAAGDNGLFISTNNGNSWRQVRGLRSANNSISERASFQGVVAARNRIWTATTEGLASTTDGGATWSITRTNFPLSGTNQFAQSAAVSSYAYPNPFSSRQHGSTRIRFSASKSGSASIKLFDTAFNLVRDLGSVSISQPGEYEVLWDGTSKNGQLVANGVIVYQIKTPDGSAGGKILILD